MFLGLFYKLRSLMYKYNNTSIFPVMFMTEGKTLSALAKIANREVGGLQVKVSLRPVQGECFNVSTG